MSITLLANLDIGEGQAAITQLAGFDFNSYADFGDGRYLAAGVNGLYEIGGTSASKPESYFKTFNVRLGYDGPKRLRYIYLGVETHGKLKITPIADDIDGPPITVTPKRSGRQVIRVTVPQIKKGAYKNRFLYCSLKVENVSGCWFSIDFIKVAPINLAMGRAGL